MKNFELLPLPFAYDALEPLISKTTLHYHHEKHHQGYVDQLNKLLVEGQFVNDSLEQIICKSEGPIYDNAAQCWNHDFYWKCMTPLSDEQQPTGKLLQALKNSFGTLEKFKSEFKKKGASFFGVGWLWLVANQKGELSLITTRDAQNPMRDALTPILVCDLWEHAYYLDYQNLRSKYLDGFFEIMNWEFAETRYEQVIKTNDIISIANPVRMAS